MGNSVVKSCVLFFMRASRDKKGISEGFSGSRLQCRQEQGKKPVEASRLENTTGK